MIELLSKFEKKDPELILVWNDSQTEAKGWLVINSLKGGAAGGGRQVVPRQSTRRSLCGPRVLPLRVRSEAALRRRWNRTQRRVPS